MSPAQTWVGCYGYDTVVMQRRIQGETLYMCDQFGVDGKVPAGVIRTSCFITKLYDVGTFLNIFSSSRSEEDTDSMRSL